MPDAAFNPEMLSGFSGFMQCAATDRSLKLDVNCMVFDGHGTLWMGLSNGLLRCDGDRQTLYRSLRKDSTSIPNNAVSSLLVDSEDRLWVGTQSGLARFDRSAGYFERYRVIGDSVNSVRSNRFWSLYEDGGGAIYCSTESGIQVLDPHTRTFHRIEFRMDGKDPFDPTHFFQGTCSSSDGTRVFAATTLGIMQIDLGSGSVHPLTEKPSSGNGTEIHMTTLCAHGPDHLWFFDKSRQQLGLLNTRNGATSVWPAPKGKDDKGMCRWLRSGPGQKLWMETWDNQLFLMDLAAGEAVEVFPALASASLVPGGMAVRQMMTDPAGRTWLATSQGALALMPMDPRVKRWKTPELREPDSEFTCIYQRPDGMVILGSYGAGIHLLDPITGQWSTIARTFAPRGSQYIRAENSVLCIEPLSEDKLLIGTYHGILLLDLKKRQLVDLPDFERASTRLTRAQIMDLQFDERGRLWVATWRDGLLCYDPQSDTCRRFMHDPSNPRSLPIDRLLCLMLDRSGRLWVGANDGGGVCRYDEGTDGFVRYPMDADAPLSTSMGVVRCMAEDSTGTIWIGTHAGGLAQLDPSTGSFTSYDRSDGLPGDLVRSMTIHPRFGIWVGGPEGLARWNSTQKVFYRAELGVDWRTEPMDMQVMEKEGKLLVLNGTKVELIDLTRIDEGTSAPKPVLLEVRLNGVVNHRDSTSSELSLQEGRDRVSFEFALQDPIRAQDTRIAWRLRGRNEQWEDCLGCRSLSFSDLPKGAYELEVRAMRSDGQWDTPTSLATFSVLPPFWATWWFRIGTVLVLAGAAFAAFRLYLRERLREQRERMEREQAILSERVRIAGDMHDDLGAGLSALKLKSEMALRVEKDPAKREQLGALASTAGELIGSMRQIIWTMNGDQTSVEDLVVYTTSYARNYCEQNALTVEVKADGPWPAIQLTTEQRRNVFLVVKEALHNVVKHAHAKEVRLTLEWRDGLVVEIADDGVGLSRGAEGGQGNGLRNMEKRIKVLGGSLELNNGSQPGTSIRFRVAFAPTPNQGSIASSNGR